MVHITLSKTTGMFSVSKWDCLNRHQYAGLIPIFPAIHLMLKQSFHQILLLHPDRCLL